MLSCFLHTQYAKHFKHSLYWKNENGTSKSSFPPTSLLRALTISMPLGFHNSLSLTYSRGHFISRNRINKCREAYWLGHVLTNPDTLKQHSCICVNASSVWRCVRFGFTTNTLLWFTFASRHAQTKPSKWFGGNLVPRGRHLFGQRQGLPVPLDKATQTLGTRLIWRHFWMF